MLVTSSFDYSSSWKVVMFQKSFSPLKMLSMTISIKIIWTMSNKISSWLLALMNMSILTQLVGLSSSSQIWNKLSVYHASQSRAKVKILEIQLHTPKERHNYCFISSWYQEDSWHISCHLFTYLHRRICWSYLGWPLMILSHMWSQTDPYAIC